MEIMKTHFSQYKHAHAGRYFAAIIIIISYYIYKYGINETDIKVNYNDISIMRKFFLIKKYTFNSLSLKNLNAHSII